MILGVIWAIAGLNILGIRENARVTFGIFIVAAFVLVNLIALGFLHLESGSARIILGSAQGVVGSVTGAGLPHAVAVVTVGVASCILAYSGIESVILTGALYTSIILLTAGSQAVLAEMYAVSLLASFCINIGCLLIYRYFQGTKEIRAYHTSRTGTLLLEFMLLACFVYLAAHRPHGTGLWAAVVEIGRASCRERV